MHEFIVLASVEEVQLFNNQQFFNTATSLCTVPLSTFPMTFSIFIVNVISSFISVTIISFQLIYITVIFFFKNSLYH